MSMELSSQGLLPHETARWYANLAAGILLQAHNDARRMPKAYGGEVRTFAGSEWCEALCDMVGLEHEIYIDDISRLLRRKV